MSIGARLRAERERLGYSQEGFAALGGASKRSQIDWEKGIATPNAAFLALASASGVDVRYVITGEHDSAALAVDEKRLLALYRLADEPLRKAALRVLVEGDAGVQAIDGSVLDALVTIHPGANVGSVLHGDQVVRGGQTIVVGAPAPAPPPAPPQPAVKRVRKPRIDR